MKVLLTMILLTLITGCTPYNNVNTAKGEYLCKDDGGLYTIDTLSEYPIMCRSGKRWSVKDLESVVIMDKKYYIE